MKAMHIYDNISLNSSENEKYCRQNLYRNSKHAFTFNIFFPKVVPFTMGKYDRARWATDGDIIRCMCFVCWIPKATDTHSEYVIYMACPLRRWLNERASMLCYMYSTLPVLSKLKTSSDIPNVYDINLSV